jgi:uncharacterized protein (TIGR00266 family)
MRIETRHRPSFAVVRAHLAPGETIQAEAGAMAAHSLGVEVEATMQGGLMKSLSRSVLGGESLFITTYRAHAQHPGWVDLAARLPGDALSLEVTPERGIVLTRGSWLGAESGVTLDTKWGGFGNLVGGEGGFTVHVTGRGQVIAACYGALDRHDLPEGGGFTVDTGHVVAYEDRVRPELRRASRQGFMTSAKSGEGYVFDFVGPGTVWTQSRNPNEFVSWLAAVLPQRQ